MARWSLRTREIRREIKQYRIEEFAEALAEYLDKNGYTHKNDLCIKKDKLYSLVVDYVNDVIRHPDGIFYLPTIENKVVPEPDETFLKNNWSEITTECAMNRNYIVWDWSGVRLGTLEEYTELQKILKSIANGVTDSHNTNSEIINKHGGQCSYYGLVIQSLPSGK